MVCWYIWEMIWIHQRAFLLEQFRKMVNSFQDQIES
ncbi:unnamed protein product [Musa acuminata subsp. malaccensis]|uniref:(wild Malaysian banana) hypothetical protein n=1 Tax=Musa acuminata subsp. malaccensis TaxID=214687 RepID=A0A804HPB9_MUSAM|nr:unnamed protein product [Musa acuminata subsp. malaccensis]